MRVSTNAGGSKEFLNATNTFRHFQLLSNELGAALLLACPADTARKPATNFSNFGNGNLSYFLGVEAAETNGEALLAGDRNIVNGFAPTRGILELTTNQAVGWTKAIHRFEGNIAMGDGSVQQVNNERLRTNILPNTDFATNRIQLP